MPATSPATRSKVDPAPAEDVQHERFCLPRPGAEAPRVERYPATRGEGREAVTVTVTRCIECGAERVDE